MYEAEKLEELDGQRRNVSIAKLEPVVRGENEKILDPPAISDIRHMIWITAFGI